MALEGPLMLFRPFALALALLFYSAADAAATLIIAYHGAGTNSPGARRCCTNRNWPARCQSTRSSPADAIRHWSAEGGHPIEDLTADDGLTPLPGRTPGAKAIADDGLVSEERILHPALTMVP